MSLPLGQHQTEIEHNLAAWHRKPLLQRIYASFYERILKLVDSSMPGRVVEIGSGIGNLRTHLPHALCTDLFPNPWLDFACDGYELPFATRSVSHLILFDVFHHLQRPAAFLEEARRALVPGGRVILFEPFISFASLPVYGLFHHEPVAWQRAIDLGAERPAARDYYAAQGNATRLFFRREKAGWPNSWNVFHAEAFSSFSYLLSGGIQQARVIPAKLAPVLARSRPPAFPLAEVVRSAVRGGLVRRAKSEIRRPKSERNPKSESEFRGTHFQPLICANHR